MRWADPDGDDWPITGLTCHVCRLPLDLVLAGDGTHPNCAYERNDQ